MSALAKFSVSKTIEKLGNISLDVDALICAIVDSA
jgi:hypothetical protein